MSPYPPTHIPAVVILAFGIVMAGISITCLIWALVMNRRRADRDLVGFGFAMLGFFLMADLAVTAIFRAYTWSWLFPATSPADHDTTFVLYTATLIAAIGIVLCYLPAYCEHQTRLAFEDAGLPRLR